MSRSNDGTLLQDKTQEVLDERKQRLPEYYTRYPDSKAARRLIHNAPGDFIWNTKAKAVLLECKSTVKSASLLSLAKAEPAQIGYHKLWLRSGLPSLYLYADYSKGVLEAYCGKQVVEAVASGSRKLLPIIHVPSLDYTKLLNECETFITYS